MVELVRKFLAGQFEASLCMMHDCVRKCPPEHWEGAIAKYPFWQVAYHALCFADLYLSPDEASFQLRDDLHPRGWSELNDEYPSRRFDQPEITGYVDICRRKATETLATETAESLGRAAGFPWLPFSRGELHVYNLRHVQHHVGQLSAFLRRVGQEPQWTKTGWR